MLSCCKLKLGDKLVSKVDRQAQMRPKQPTLAWSPLNLFNNANPTLVVSSTNPEKLTSWSHLLWAGAATT